MVGRILLWVIGIPLLILLFAVLALARGLWHLGTGSAAPAAPTPSGPHHSYTL